MTRQITLGNHLVTVDTRSDTAVAFWDLVDKGLWEPGTLRVIVALAGPGRSFFDVGAWIGPTALAAASNGFTVVAWEPDPVASAELRANCALNGFDVDKIQLVEAALAPRAGRAWLSPATALGDSESSLIRGRRSATATSVETVEGRAALRALRLPRDSVLKIDIEGGEYALLPSLWGLLAHRRTVVMLSTHPERVSPLFGAQHSARVRRLTAVGASFLGNLAILPYVFSHSWWEDRPHSVTIRRLGLARLLLRLFGGKNRSFYLFPRTVRPPEGLLS